MLSVPFNYLISITSCRAASYNATHTKINSKNVLRIVFSDFNGEWNINKGVRNLSLPNGYHRKNGEDAGQYEDKPWECVKCGLIDPSVDGCGDQACKFEGQLEHDKGNAYGRKCS